VKGVCLILLFYEHGAHYTTVKTQKQVAADVKIKGSAQLNSFEEIKKGEKRTHAVHYFLVHGCWLTKDSFFVVSFVV